jgi:hypothetical protein
MTDVDPFARICVVCGRVLEQYLSEGTVHYQHAKIDESADHPPIAVRSADAPAQARPRCDFCLGEPITHTMVLDKELAIEEAGLLWDTEWAMCATCTDLALADDWLGLRRHAFSSFEERHGPMGEHLKLRMRLIYRDIRQSVVMYYQEPG